LDKSLPPDGRTQNPTPNHKKIVKHTIRFPTRVRATLILGGEIDNEKDVMGKICFLKDGAWNASKAGDD
jgi:hypothetical protein